MTTLEAIGLLLIILGLILIFIEMLLPGFGAPGITGSICSIVGVVLFAKNVEQGLTLAIIIVVIIAIMMTIVVLFFHKGKDKSPIKLQEKLETPEEFLSTVDVEYLVGKTGVTVTDLRPAGKCDVDGITFDVRSEGSYITKNSQVRIIKVQGNTLIVKCEKENETC